MLDRSIIDPFGEKIEMDTLVELVLEKKDIF